MAIFTGPNVDDSTIIFRVDAANPKLVVGDTLMSLPDKESRSVKILNDDYAYNDNLNFTPYSPLVVSNLNALTVFAFVDDAALGSGTLLSMASDASSAHLPLQSTVDARTQATTLATGTIDCSYTSTPLQSTVDARTVTTTLATSVVNSAYTSTPLQSTVDARTVTTTLATGVDLCWYKPLYEVSVGFDRTGGIVASYRHSTYEFTSTHAPLDTINNVYKIVFECVSEVSNEPISIYAGDQLISKSTSATGTSYFEDWPVSLFNRANSANYAQFGVRSIIVCSGKATEDQTQKINNLARR